MKKQYRWLLLGASAVAFIASNAFTIFQDADHDLRWKIIQLLAVSLSISTHFLSLFAVAAWMQRRYPGLALTRVRVARALAYGVPLVSLLIGASDMWQTWLRGDELQPTGLLAMLATLFQGLAIAIFVIGLHEAFYQYEQLRRSETEKEALLRLNLTAQYDSLKQQVNPHFLFNSLNSLSALIMANPPQAAQFVDELSGVYRYLLQTSREELVSLGAELGFIRSYLHLLKTRFGPAFQVSLDLPESYQNRLIPPLTLQLLIENAVKHNEVSMANPLQLSLSIEHPERLRIANNLQPKTIVVPSEKIGLANILAKYRLLHQPEVVVQFSDTEFVVLLPLIQPNTVS